jgi:uracil-DNA glycosylase
MTNQNIKLHPSWLKVIGEEFNKPYMQQLKQFLLQEKAEGRQILPKPNEWFNALNLTPFDKVKVVILGQDPYPTASHPHGLAFSVRPEVKPLPKSLVNIYQELKEDLGIDNFHCGNLQHWAEQGVLLLNPILTVEAGKSLSHQNKGWEPFTDAVLKAVSDHKEHVVFILWGAKAQKKAALIDPNKHLIIKSPHPSPLSAYRGFFGSKPFSKTNAYLQAHGLEPIDWRAICPQPETGTS